MNDLPTKLEGESMKKGILYILFAAPCMLFATQAIQAAPIVFELNTEYSAAGEKVGSTLLSATFKENGQFTVAPGIFLNIVQLTIETTGLSSQEHIGSFFFNTKVALGLNDFSFVSGQTAANILTGDRTAGTATGFDVEFQFGNEFVSGQKSVYDITYENLTPDDFNIKNLDDTGLFYSAAFLSGFRWIAATKEGINPKPVPEPATMLLLCIGLTGFAFFGRKKFLER
jgi:hypothetical protein